MPRLPRRRPRAERLTEILARRAESDTGSVTLADVVAAVGARSFGALLVFLPSSFANLVPATGILLFGFALLERDGLVALFSGVAFAFLTAAGHTVRQLGFTGG